MEKSAGIPKLIDENAVSSFKPWKSQLFINSIFIDCINSLIQFWLIIVAPSGMKSEPDCEFESLGSQKVDIHVLGKKSILQWKLSYPFKLKV